MKTQCSAAYGFGILNIQFSKNAVQVAGGRCLLQMGAGQMGAQAGLPSWGPLWQAGGAMGPRPPRPPCLGSAGHCFCFV